MMGDAYDHLCPACTRIFTDNPLDRLSSKSSAWKFHSTLFSMRKSELDGCRLCTLILSSSDVLRRRVDDKQDDLSSTGSPSPKPSLCKYTLALFAGEDVYSPRGINIYVLSILIDHGEVSKFTACISPIDRNLTRNTVGRRTTPPGSIAASTLQQIKNWMSTCLVHHETCRDSWMLVAAERKLPTRLLDISDLDRLRVIHTSHLPPSTIYITLSHRWSSMSFVSLTTETYDEFSKSIPLSSMPRTFREAIEVTRLLGVQYIWIDSLCIVQDSRDDWLHESSMMGEIYAHGSLNIAATAAEDGNGGIFGRNISKDQWLPRLISTQQWTNGSPDESSRDFIIYPEFDPAYPEVWKNLVEETPLGERGWVLQERILSPRVLHFAANQCFWECCQETEAELFPKETFRHDGFLKQIVVSVPPDHAIFDQHQDVLYIYWDAMIEKYSRCDLTFETDKLVAFAGLARRACRQLNLDPSDYMAGLWRPKIAQGLLWRVARYDPRRRKVENRGPSWSWISREGTVYTFSEEVQPWRTEQCHISILGHEIFHNGDPFGQITGGRMVVRGCLFENVFPFLTNPDVDWGKDDEIEYPVSYFLLVLTHRAGSTGDCSVISGVVLVPTGLKRGQFKRVGVMLHEEIQDPDLFLKHGKRTELLHESLYQVADPDKGFTIELV